MIWLAAFYAVLLVAQALQLREPYLVTWLVLFAAAAVVAICKRRAP